MHDYVYKLRLQVFTNNSNSNNNTFGWVNVFADLCFQAEENIDLEELEQFAKTFKRRRIELGKAVEGSRGGIVEWVRQYEDVEIMYFTQ